MADNLKVLQDEILNTQELERINAIMDFITNTNGLPTQQDIMDIIVQSFNDNSKTLLMSEGTPLYILLSCIAKLGQLNAGLIKQNVSKMLYTQTSGDDLSLCASNYGYTRIEAKNSSMVIVITTDKDITLSKDTSFTDSKGNVWLTQQEVQISKEIPTRVNLVSAETGAITYISPIVPTNTIAGLVSMEVDNNSIVIGREQESDTELKETIASGISIQGSDSACKRALLQLRMVNSAFVQTNPYAEATEYMGVMIDSRQRYISLRVTNPIISKEEADLISQAISNNTIYNANYQKPQDGYVKYFFGLTEEELTKPETEGGAGLNGVKDDSMVVLVRQTLIYGNYVDIYFSLAQPTDIYIELMVRYKSNYTNSEKENIAGNIKQIVSQAVSELSQVGASLLVSDIVEKIVTISDLGDKLSIRSALLKLSGSTGAYQALDSKSYEYFRVYDSPEKPYAGIIITEG